LTQEQRTVKKEITYIEYIQKLHSTALDILEGQSRWDTRKKDLILGMKDMYLEMIAKGFYEKRKSDICSDICAILKTHKADENAFAYVRMVLPSEFKDQTKVTFDNIIHRAFKQNKDSIDKEKINLLESFKKEDFDGLTPEEIMLFKTEYADVIKESKRRIRDNRQIVNIVSQDIKINSALVSEHKFPDMNQKVKSILLELRTVIKNSKKINRLINFEADKATENRNFDYNDELDDIYEQTRRLTGMTSQLISLLN
jgi:hypothetical protein